MKIQDSKHLKLTYQIIDGDDRKPRSTSYTKIQIDSSDEQIKAVGDALLTAMDVSSKNVIMIDSFTLV